VVDECHRGSAADDSAWREVLDYFSSATQLGMTATPKETCDVSTTHYFGEPVYTYSLKQGIEDGFLAPYKVVRIDLDKDLAGWRPPKGKVDAEGLTIEDKIYSQQDFDRTLVLTARTELVARKVTDFLRATDRFDKTIVFCEDIDHASRMREELINQNQDLVLQNRKYVMQITGDNPEGKAELDNFIHPEERYPVVVTTSKLMTTGVDAKTCKVIVLDQVIRSMTEFKQIIGRGTRIEEDFGKLFFTILDFRKATEMFADPDFDGPPLQVYQPKPGDPLAPPDDSPGDDAPTQDLHPQGNVDAVGPWAGAGPDGGDGAGGKRVKYVVKDVPVFVVAERVQYMGRDGKLISESLREFSRKTIREQYASLDSFLKTWSEADRKLAIVKELAEHGVFFEELAREVGKEMSAFDLVCHIAFDQPALTRRERAKKVRKTTYFEKFGDAARAVLEALVDKFENGDDNIEDLRVLQVQPISDLGTPVEIVAKFGGKAPYLEAVRGLEDELYDANHGPKSA
jgi:type I restriction enzyme, R subunit